MVCLFEASACAFRRVDFVRAGEFVVCVFVCELNNVFVFKV